MLALFKRANDQCICCKIYCKNREKCERHMCDFTNDARNNRNRVAFKKCIWFCHKIGDFSIIVLK